MGAVPVRRLVVSLVVFAVTGSLFGCSSRSVARSLAAVRISCSGHPLATVDSDEIGSGQGGDAPQLSPPPASVRGRPRLVRLGAARPSELDPQDSRYGYVTSGWRVSRVNASTGAPAWTAVVRPPTTGHPPTADPDLDLELHSGYVVLTGNDQWHSYIAVVTSQGTVGAACTLPTSLTVYDHVELLPHADVLVLQNVLDTTYQAMVNG